jgi:hypothetical protein
MKRLLVILAVLAAAVVLPATPSAATWVGSNCYPDSTPDSNVTRTNARNYVDNALGEGYEWGGGCWNNNDVDDTPSQPDSSGEGPDCSGLVYKTWELRSDPWDAGFTWYFRLHNTHGPYSTDDFHAPVAADPFFKLANKWRSTTLFMDAFAKDGHIGLLYTSDNPGSNTDYIAEALGDSPGTDLYIETYRFDAAYVGVRRQAWTPECYPNCGSAIASPVVTVP